MSYTQDNMVSININGSWTSVPAGMNMIEAAAKMGIEIPHYCYHPHLSVVGNCRMCLIEMGMPVKDKETGAIIKDEAGNAKVNWMPRPTIGCALQASEGLHIRTDSKLVKDCQNGVMEFLLVNHPLDCPICDQAGECRLQEFATDYGRGYSRFVEAKNIKPKQTRLGPRVTLDDERCILCSRCIRFCDEIVKDPVLGFFNHGSHTTLGAYPGEELANNYSLNTVDLCPVGALTSTDFRFRMRVWFLKQTDSICSESSSGTNTTVWSREGKIYRITPRRNDGVNDHWMTDSGRELYKQVESEKRLTRASSNGTPVSLESSLVKAAQTIQKSRCAFVCSGHLSLEEQFCLKQLAGERPVYLMPFTGAGDTLLYTRDHSPNVRGALVSGLIKDLSVLGLTALYSAIKANQIDSLFVIGAQVLDLLDPNVIKNCQIIFMGSHQPVRNRAQDRIPGLTVFEKSGSFVNQQFRLQRFKKAIPGPSGVASDWENLAYIKDALQHNGQPQAASVPNFQALWEQMSQSCDLLKQMQWEKIPRTGHLLDAKAFEAFDFVEQEGLHYRPTKVKSTANA